jgi:GAF domain-containing protein
VPDIPLTWQSLAQRERLAALGLAISTILAQCRPIALQLQGCAQAIVDRLPVAFVRIWRHDEAQRMLLLEASAGLYTNLRGSHSRVPVGRLKIGAMVIDRLPRLTNRVLEEDWVTDKDWARREHMVAFAGYPLIAQDRVTGVMGMFAREPLSPEVLEALGSIAGGIAESMLRAEAAEQMQAQLVAYRNLVRKLEASEAALQEKVADLEEIERLVVSRELRMIELERELVRLKGLMIADR